MDKGAKRPGRIAALGLLLAGVLALGAIAGFVAMIWSVYQVLMLPF